MPVYGNNCSKLFHTDENTCMNCRKKTHSLLSDLNHDELALLNKDKYGVVYKSGETICKAGTIPTGLICLNEGKVKITRTGINGNEQIIKLKAEIFDLQVQSSTIQRAIQEKLQKLNILQRGEKNDIIRPPDKG